MTTEFACKKIFSINAEYNSFVFSSTGVSSHVNSNLEIEAYGGFEITLQLLGSTIFLSRKSQ